MATTQNTFTGNGSNLGPFSFTFKWLESTDIKVSVGGVLKTAGTHYNLQSLNYTTKAGGQVLFTAGNAPANGASIRIFRDTDDDALSAVFSSGSAIRAKDLNDNFTQNLYVTQEINNNAVSIDGSNPMVSDFNMNGYKVTNLAAPVAGTDAANRSFVEGVFSSQVPVFYRRWSKTAVGGETGLSGNDDNGIALSYVPGSEKVFINGALQVRGIDYSGTTGSTLSGIPALTAGDIIEVHSSSSYTVGTVPDGSVTNAKVDGGAAIQSTKLAFIQNGTGAVTRTVESKLRDVVSVKDFGAVGNGFTNDTAAIQAALTHAVGVSSSKIVFPNGTYKCNALLGSYTGSNIEIDLQGSTLDFSGLSLAEIGPLLEFTGTYDATSLLTSDITSGVKTVSVASSGFAAGNMVRIYSSAIWDPARTSTRIGELNFVESVPSGASLDLTTEPQSSYTVAQSATVQKITPVKNVVIRNGIIIGPSGNDEILGLRIRAGSACLIENIRSYDIDKIHVQLTDCVFSKVTKCHFEQSNHSSQAYGVSFADACQDCTAVDNSFVDVRHSMTTNNNVSTSYGITRRILFSSNVVSDSAQATGGSGGDAIDTHAGAEDIFIIGNTVNSSSNYGVNFEARTGSVSNNFIRNTASGGIYINPRATSAGTITVNGNTLLSIGDASAEYGILVTAQTADIVNCTINGNRVVSFAQPIRVTGQFGFKTIRTIVSSNAVQKQSSSTTLNGIEVTAADSASVTGNSVSAGAVGIVLTDCNSSVICGNSVEVTNTSGSAGYGVRLSGTCSYINVSGNALYYSASGLTTTIGVSFAPTTITYSGAWNNVTRGFTTNVNVSTGTGNVSANNI
jgi:hypothetical protein